MENAKVVWVNGVFDVLHVGHTRLLEHAAMYGDKLAVGIDSDRRVRENKGAQRPINTLIHRIEMLYALRFVDIVYHFDTDEELTYMMKSSGATIMFVGEEWKGKKIVGAEECGMDVRYYKKQEDISSTNILNKI